MTAPHRPRLPFTKAQGAGNDYLLVDGIRCPLDPADGPDLARRMSDRHFGVGADGLIVLAPEADPACVGRMWMWNADGSRGAMCGNGLRLLGRFAREQGHAPEDAMVIATDVGPRPVALLREAGGGICGARVEFPPVLVAPAPLPLPGGVPGLPPGAAIHGADAGNPHGVVFVPVPPDELDLAPLGMALQQDPRFPGGVNVELVQVAAGGLVQRTWERGSGETLACGSGALAAVAVAWATGRLDGKRVEVRLQGGVLVVERGHPGGSLVLEGPAHTVCQGSWPTGGITGR